MTQMVDHLYQKFKVCLVMGEGGSTNSSKVKILLFIGKLDVLMDGWMNEYVHTYINICINHNKEGIKREIRTNAWNPGIMMYPLSYGFKFRTTDLLHQKQCFDSQARLCSKER